MYEDTFQMDGEQFWYLGRLKDEYPDYYMYNVDVDPQTLYYYLINGNINNILMFVIQLDKPVLYRDTVVVNKYQEDIKGNKIIIVTPDGHMFTFTYDKLEDTKFIGIRNIEVGDLFITNDNNPPPTYINRLKLSMYSDQMLSEIFTYINDEYENLFTISYVNPREVRILVDLLAGREVNLIKEIISELTCIVDHKPSELL